MDTSENYLKMCKEFFIKHPEFKKIYNYKNNAFIIPEGKKHSEKIGNFMITTKETPNINNIFVEINKVPIPTIDESISFIPDLNYITLIKLLNNFINCEKDPALYEQFQFGEESLEKLFYQRRKYKTIEQLMLGFVGHFKFKEIWNGEKWISEQKFIDEKT